MEFHAMLDFIQTRMRMAHIYQPIMIRTLLDNRGEADTVRWTRIKNKE
jgi:hypothetical protein